MPKQERPPFDKPQLAKPGAGLPRLETWFLRYVYFPLYCRLTSTSKAIRSFEHTSARIAMLVANRPYTVQNTPVLVPRLRGIEDSSRYWSPLDVLEHLILVTDPVVLLASALASGEKPKVKIRIKDVKPKNQLKENGVAIFSEHMQRAGKTLRYLSRWSTKNKVAHPWLGPLNSRQWIKLLAMHQKLHKRQIEQILLRAPEV